jgi:hypothetical protein
MFATPYTSSSLLCAALAAICVSCGACNQHQCVTGQFKCDNGALMQCDHDFAYGPGETGDSWTWETQVNCGEAALCYQTDLPVEIDDTTYGPPFADCVLSAVPEPGCNSSVASSATCNSGLLTACFFGLPAAKYQCARCDVDNAGQPVCRGYIGDTCSSASECAPGLRCDTFVVDDGGVDAGTLCTSSCQIDADCKPITGVTSFGGQVDGGPRAGHGWPTPVQGFDKCVAGSCRFIPTAN